MGYQLQDSSAKSRRLFCWLLILKTRSELAVLTEQHVLFSFVFQNLSVDDDALVHQYTCVSTLPAASDCVLARHSTHQTSKK